MASRGLDEGVNETGDCKRTERSELAFRTTLSTSTSSFEALDPHDPQLNRLASVAFSGEKTIKYILYTFRPNYSRGEGYNVPLSCGIEKIANS